MDAKALREKMAAAERSFRDREFLALYTPQSKSAHVRIEGVVCKFRIVGHQGSGLGMFKVISGDCAKYVGEPDFDVMRSFLDVLPQIHLILCYESDKGWVGYPMNLESSNKSLGLNGEVYIKNVADCERFDVVVSRFDGVNFWYDEIFVGANLEKSQEMRNCFQKDATPQSMRSKLDKIKGVSPEDRKAFDLAIASWVVFQQSSTEQRLKNVLQDSGATLGSYVVRGDNIEVRWSTDRETEYTSLVSKENMDVVSAGICLAGEDTNFHLRDLPYIIKEGEDRGLIYTTDIRGRYQEDRRDLNRRDVRM